MEIKSEDQRLIYRGKMLDDTKNKVRRGVKERSKEQGEKSENGWLDNIIRVSLKPYVPPNPFFRSLPFELRT
jgi:hypothetical protein